MHLFFEYFRIEISSDSKPIISSQLIGGSAILTLRREAARCRSSYWREGIQDSTFEPDLNHCFVGRFPLLREIYSPVEL